MTATIAIPNRPPDLEVVAFGDAKTKGSTFSFVPKTPDGRLVMKGDRPVVVTKNDAGAPADAWAGVVAAACGRRMAETGMAPIAAHVPVVVELVFFRVRPRGHFGTGRNAGVLKESAPAFPIAKKGDIDKLERCVLDALKGVTWADDCQVVGLPTWLRFGEQARMELRLWTLPATVGELRTPQLAGSS